MSRPVNSQDLGTMASAARSSSPMAPMDTSSPRAKVEKTGVMYSPFGSEDMVTMAMGENYVRLAKKKPPYAIILPDDQREEFLANLDSKIDEKRQSRNKGVALERQSLTHLRQSVTNPLTLSDLDPNNSKLYILGHGDAGDDTLNSGTEHSISAKGLAGNLRQLPSNYQDLRALSCNSADKGVSDEAPFAQHLARSMGATHPHLTVTGYRGEHMMAPDAHHHEQGNLDGKGVDPNNTVRRSTVKATFRPLK